MYLQLPWELIKCGNSVSDQCDECILERQGKVSKWKIADKNSANTLGSSKFVQEQHDYCLLLISQQTGILELLAVSG